jgi:hypothetical protein
VPLCLNVTQLLTSGFFAGSRTSAVNLMAAEMAFSAINVDAVGADPEMRAARRFVRGAQATTNQEHPCLRPRTPSRI